MNKVVKVISILLIAVMVIAALPKISFAKDEQKTDGSPSSVISSFADNQGYQSEDIAKVNGIAVRVLKAVRNIAIIAAVLIISILGVKYMIGSVEEKAGYKKAFMPLIIGAILVVAAAQIATMLFSLGA